MAFDWLVFTAPHFFFIMFFSLDTNCHVVERGQMRDGLKLPPVRGGALADTTKLNQGMKDLRSRKDCPIRSCNDALAVFGVTSAACHSEAGQSSAQS